jgi:cell wall-associated NlpC family hydrolase
VAEGEHLVLTGTQIAGYAQTWIGGHQRWVSTTYLASTPAWGNTGSKGEVALAFARGQLGKPYGYGCSGLVQAAWRAAGVPGVAKQAAHWVLVGVSSDWPVRPAISRAFGKPLTSDRMIMKRLRWRW